MGRTLNATTFQAWRAAHARQSETIARASRHFFHFGAAA